MDFKFIKTDYLDMVAGSDSGLVRELIDLFREQVAEIYSGMKNLLAERNYIELGHLAHKAKSSVAIMGMEDLAELLRKFECEAGEGKKSEMYDSYISKFGNDTRSALLELDTLINNK